MGNIQRLLKIGACLIQGTVPLIGSEIVVFRTCDCVKQVAFKTDFTVYSFICFWISYVF